MNRTPFFALLLSSKETSDHDMNTKALTGVCLFFQHYFKSQLFMLNSFLKHY